MSCPARIHTSIHDFKVLKFSAKKHCHDSEAARIEADTAITSMRQRAILTMEPTSCVINECVNGLSDAAKVHTLNFISLSGPYCNN